MENLLISWSEINSGSYNLTGLANMAKALIAEFSQICDGFEEIKLPAFERVDDQGQIYLQPVGNLLHFYKRKSATSTVFLCGHYDTVYGSTEAFQTVQKPESNILIGPGVTDMKGGLVTLLFALKEFEKTPGAENLGWHVYLNPDEEISSPGSIPFIKDMAKTCDFALVFEPALDTKGTLVSARKGAGKFSIVVHGKAAHAGRDFDKGRNAIAAAAKLVTAIDALNGKRSGVTLNTGLIRGGTVVNVVPETCVIHIDVRIEKPEDGIWVSDQINQFVKEIPGFTVDLHGGFHRPPKLCVGKTIKLLSEVVLTGKKMGLDIQTALSGGCTDGNNIAAVGVPVVDCMGVRGGKIHSHEEFILLDSLPERAKLTQLLLTRYANKEFDLGD